MGLYRNLSGFGGLVVKKWSKILGPCLGSIEPRNNYKSIGLK
jgi:hypothetical protein